MKTVLLMSCLADLRQSIRDDLDKEGYIIIEACHIERMYRVIEEHKVDLIVFDYDLSTENAVQKFLDQYSKIEIPMFLLSFADKQDKINACLQSGIVDLIKKPFDRHELTLRINLFFNRADHDDLYNKKTREVKFGDWAFTPEQYCLKHKNGKKIDLTRNEFLLMECFTANQNIAVRKEHLCDYLRRDNYVPTARALDITVTRLRKKLKETNRQYIQTIHGVGYLFNEQT